MSPPASLEKLLFEGKNGFLMKPDLPFAHFDSHPLAQPNVFLHERLIRSENSERNINTHRTF
jgi:hypothetical protein